MIESDKKDHDSLLMVNEVAIKDIMTKSPKPHDSAAVTAEQEGPPRNTSLPSAIFNLTKSAIGVGTLFLAYSVSQMGLLLGLGMLLVASLTCIGSLHFLAKTASQSGMVGNYFQLGRMALGLPGELSALASLVFYLLGGLIAYSSVVGQYLSRSLVFFINPSKVPWYCSEKFLTVLAGVLLILPLSCLRDMRLLARTSLAGLLCMLYICLLTVVDFFVDRNTAAPIVLVRFSMAFFSAFCTILFAYTNHFTMVALVPVLKDPSPVRLSKLNLISSVIVFAVYALVGGFGYGHFGDDLKGNILTAPASPSWPYAIAQFAVGLVIICSYPLLADPARAAIEQIIAMCLGTKRTTQSVWWKKTAFPRHLAITLLLVTLSTVIAVTLAKQVLLILGVFTALGGSLLMYIFPTLYFLRLAPSSGYQIAHWERALAYFNGLFGLILLCMGTYAGVAEMIRSL